MQTFEKAVAIKLPGRTGESCLNKWKQMLKLKKNPLVKLIIDNKMLLNNENKVLQFYKILSENKHFKEVKEAILEFIKELFEEHEQDQT